MTEETAVVRFRSRSVRDLAMRADRLAGEGDLEGARAAIAEAVEVGLELNDELEALSGYRERLEAQEAALRAKLETPDQEAPMGD